MLLERLPRHPKLGRSIQHDPRSLRFAVPSLPRAALLPVHWQRRAPIWDQGDISCCTGNAAAGWIVTDNASRSGLTAVDGVTVDEAFAVSLYELATQLDDFPETYPPDDIGSSGLGAVKGLQQKGLVASYNHAFSFSALCAGMQDGPAMIGVPWFNSMFETESDGHIEVVSASGLAGGHEILATQLEINPSTHEVERVWIDNSWGASWAVQGRGYFTADELQNLLSQDGDVVCPVAATKPAVVTEMPLSITDANAINKISAAAKRAKQTESEWATHHFAQYFKK